MSPSKCLAGAAAVAALAAGLSLSPAGMSSANAQGVYIGTPGFGIGIGAGPYDPYWGYASAGYWGPGYWGPGWRARRAYRRAAYWSGWGPGYWGPDYAWAPGPLGLLTAPLAVAAAPFEALGAPVYGPAYAPAYAPTYAYGPGYAYAPRVASTEVSYGPTLAATEGTTVIRSRRSRAAAVSARPLRVAHRSSTRTSVRTTTGMGREERVRSHKTRVKAAASERHMNRGERLQRRTTTGSGASRTRGSSGGQSSQY